MGGSGFEIVGGEEDRTSTAGEVTHMSHENVDRMFILSESWLVGERKISRDR